MTSAASSSGIPKGNLSHNSHLPVIPLPPLPKAAAKAAASAAALNTSSAMHKPAHLTHRVTHSTSGSLASSSSHTPSQDSQHTPIHLNSPFSAASTAFAPASLTYSLASSSTAATLLALSRSHPNLESALLSPKQESPRAIPPQQSAFQAPASSPHASPLLSSSQYTSSFIGTQAAPAAAAGNSTLAASSSDAASCSATKQEKKRDLEDPTTSRAKKQAKAPQAASAASSSTADDSTSVAKRRRDHRRVSASDVNSMEAAASPAQSPTPSAKMESLDDLKARLKTLDQQIGRLPTKGAVSNALRQELNDSLQAAQEQMKELEGRVTQQSEGEKMSLISSLYQERMKPPAIFLVKGQEFSIPRFLLPHTPCATWFEAQLKNEVNGRIAIPGYSSQAFSNFIGHLFENKTDICEAIDETRQLAVEVNYVPLIEACDQFINRALVYKAQALLQPQDPSIYRTLFNAVVQAPFCLLNCLPDVPLSLMEDLLKHSKLGVLNELEALELITCWLTWHPNIPDADLVRLLSHVRYGTLIQKDIVQKVRAFRLHTSDELLDILDRRYDPNESRELPFWKKRAAAHLKQKILQTDPAHHFHDAPWGDPAAKITRLDGWTTVIPVTHSLKTTSGIDFRLSIDQAEEGRCTFKISRANDVHVNIALEVTIGIALEGSQLSNSWTSLKPDKEFDCPLSGQLISNDVCFLLHIQEKTIENPDN